MKIRSSVKALIVKDGKLLVIQCRRGGIDYVTLPGGGQEPQETLEQTIRRECLEETGLSVKVGSLAFVQEEIITDPHSIQKYPDYCHQHFWYFRCTLADCSPQQPTHQDEGNRFSLGPAGGGRLAAAGPPTAPQSDRSSLSA